MNTTNFEDLSAFVDGELGKSESAFFLRRFAHDDELRRRYARYHLIRDCLRSPLIAAPVDAGLAVRISGALKNETAPKRALPWRAGAQWAAGVFTAAIVAAGAFWYVQQSPETEERFARTEALPSEVQASGVRADDLRRQLPLLPVAARQSRPLRGEFAPQPDPETLQRAPVTPLHYPSTQYIIVLPATFRAPASEAAEQPR